MAFVTGIEWFRAIGESVTIVTGFIFIVCVLAFRRGIVGELAALAGVRCQKPAKAATSAVAA